MRDDAVDQPGGQQDQIGDGGQRDQLGERDEVPDAARPRITERVDRSAVVEEIHLVLVVAALASPPRTARATRTPAGTCSRSAATRIVPDMKSGRRLQPYTVNSMASRSATAGSLVPWIAQQGDIRTLRGDERQVAVVEHDVHGDRSDHRLATACDPDGTALSPRAAAAAPRRKTAKPLRRSPTGRSTPCRWAGRRPVAVRAQSG